MNWDKGNVPMKVPKAPCAGELITTPFSVNKKVVVTRMSDIEPQDVDYLWDPYIAFGKITLIEGDPEA